MEFSGQKSPASNIDSTLDLLLSEEINSTSDLEEPNGLSNCFTLFLSLLSEERSVPLMSLSF